MSAAEIYGSDHYVDDIVKEKFTIDNGELRLPMTQGMRVRKLVNMAWACCWVEALALMIGAMPMFPKRYRQERK